MNIKRSVSFLIMFLIYAAASVVAYFVYNLVEADYIIKVFAADTAATVFTFIFSLIFSNASVYDPYWSVQPIVIMAFFAGMYGLNALGILLMVAICFWGTRLTANWAYTFHGLGFQDWRYTMLKEKTKWFYPVINFVGIHMIPTIIVFLCTMPAFIAVKESIELNPLSIIFICLSIGAVILQGTADIQMHSFKKHGGTGFIRVGVWKHSRHPNYLGEILMWWGIGLASLFSMPGMWYLLTGAVCNTVLFLCVSIPMAEKHQARKPGFDEYRKQTRVLI